MIEREHGESVSDSDSVYSDNGTDFASVGRTLEAYSSRCLCVHVCVCVSFCPSTKDLGRSYKVNSNFSMQVHFATITSCLCF